MKKTVSAMLTIVILLVFGIIAAGSGSSDQPSKETNKQTSAPVQAEATKEETYALNETAAFKTLKITATDIKRSNGGDFDKPSAGNVYIGVKFTVENISSKEEIISSLLLFDAYVDGTKADQTITVSDDFSGTIDGSLAAGKNLKGWFVVEAPKNAKQIEFNVKSSWLSNQSAKFVIDIPTK